MPSSNAQHIDLIASIIRQELMAIYHPAYIQRLVVGQLEQTLKKFENTQRKSSKTIIVKDHSRLGRNRLVMGYLIEEKFPDYGVRYIAINDSVDTDKGVVESLAIRDPFNEWHARDTSKKIKAVKIAAAKRGKHIGSKPPYGYQKDPNDPKRIVPNEDTVPVVRGIFVLCASGLDPSKIARILKQEKILKATIYEYQTNGTGHTHLDTDKPFGWCSRTISGILGHEEYIGTTVNCRSYIPSFKSKKSRENRPKKRLRFENPHEPLIDRETWDMVQKIRQGKRELSAKIRELEKA